MTDFDNWYRWYKTHHDPSVTETRARQAYDEHYFCNCETCQYRKEHGARPMHLTPACQLPIDRPSFIVG